jgi:hypothetical protein
MPGWLRNLPTVLRPDNTGCPVAGLRAEPGPCVGGRGPGRRQRGDQHLVIGGRKGQSQQAIRGRSDLPADRQPVRGPFEWPPVRELEAIVEGSTRRPCCLVHRSPAERRCRGIVNGIGGFRAHGQPCRGRRCSRACGRGLLPFGIAWIGVGMHHPRRSAGRTMRQCRQPRALSGSRASAADRSGERDRNAVWARAWPTARLPRD